MLSRISVFSRLLAITVISLFALAAVGTVGIVSTGAVQDMQSRTETEAVKPIDQIGQLNELMQEAFRELLLAVQHNPAIPAVKFHNHSVKVHADALEKALQTKVAILQDYRKSRAGKLFSEQIDRVEVAEVKLADGLRQAATLIASDQAEGYSQLGIDVTVKVLPLFKEAKKQAAELLEKH